MEVIPFRAAGIHGSKYISFDQWIPVIFPSTNASAQDGYVLIALFHEIGCQPDSTCLMGSGTVKDNFLIIRHGSQS